MPASRVGGSLTVDTSDFRRFSAALRKAAPDVDKNMRTKLRAAGEIVAAEARARVSAASSSVPSSITVKVTRTTVAVSAGGPGVPMAGLLELGNAGKRGGGEFRHPVYGSRTVWVKQKMHPYLLPALEARRVEATDAIFLALDEAIKTAVTGE